MKGSFDKTLHQPLRTKIVAHLVSVDSCDYTTLKKMLDISDGHLSTHMKELLSQQYVGMEKAFVDNRPKTTYRITDQGRVAFNEYIAMLRKFILSV
jgi:predicted ArsR family transcriptional regulator